MSYFTKANFSFPVNDNDINTWADYCELFCILSENKSCSIEELKDRLLDQHQYNYEKAVTSLRLTSSRIGKHIISFSDYFEEINSAEFDEELSNSNSGNTEILHQNNDSELDDEISNEFLFLFQFLKSRNNLFADSYPFDIHLKRNHVSLHKTTLSEKQNIYIALLLSSVLRIYSPSIRNRLGHLFEELTCYSFKRMITPKANIEFFGSGSKTIGSNFFGGSFAQKVEKLSELLKTDTTTTFKQNKHDHNHSGDGGLDWVAWVPFDDGNSKIPFFFVQCACGDDWIDKEWDAHIDKWSNLIQLNDSYLLFHFVGKSFRKQDGSWYAPNKLYKIILVDRLRIINSIDSTDYHVVLPLYNELIQQALTVQLSPLD